MKKLFNYTLIPLSISLLFSCSSKPLEEVNSKMNAWKGQNIDELIKFWGLPSNQRQVGEFYYAEWLNKSSEPGNVAVSIGGGRSNRHSGIGIGLSLFDLGGSDDACSRLVTYDINNLVTDISWQGTNDYCFEMTPDLVEIQSKQKERQQTDD